MPNAGTQGAFVAAAGLVAAGIALRFGTYHPAAIVAVLAGLLLAVVACVGRPRSARARWVGPVALVAALAAVLAAGPYFSQEYPVGTNTFRTVTALT